mmetsp:Transcript_5519/g.8347  ORF Transcript_5519/g.8347 Transcript_5519/m.8347 type:complete len:245 (-) Transcript_5519:72-806(-)
MNSSGKTKPVQHFSGAVPKELAIISKINPFAIKGLLCHFIRGRNPLRQKFRLRLLFPVVDLKSQHEHHDAHPIQKLDFPRKILSLLLVCLHRVPSQGQESEEGSQCNAPVHLVLRHVAERPVDAEVDEDGGQDVAGHQQEGPGALGLLGELLAALVLFVPQGARPAVVQGQAQLRLGVVPPLVTQALEVVGEGAEHEHQDKLVHSQPQAQVEGVHWAGKPDQRPLLVHGGGGSRYTRQKVAQRV